MYQEAWIYPQGGREPNCVNIREEVLMARRARRWAPALRLQ